LVDDALQNVYSENTAGDDSFYAANYNMANLESNPPNNASAICPAYSSDQSAFAPAEEGQYDYTLNVMQEAPQHVPLDFLANADPVQDMVQTPASENIGGVFYDQSMSQGMSNESQPTYYEMSQANPFYGTQMGIDPHGMQEEVLETQNDRQPEMEGEYNPNSFQGRIRDRMLSESSSATELLPRGHIAPEYTLPVASNGDEELALASSSFAQPSLIQPPYTRRPSASSFTQPLLTQQPSAPSSPEQSQLTQPPPTQPPPPTSPVPATSTAMQNSYSHDLEWCEYDLIIYVVLQDNIAHIKRKEDRAYFELSLDRSAKDLPPSKNILIIFESNEEVLILIRAVLNKMFISSLFKMLEKTPYTNLDIVNRAGKYGLANVEDKVEDKVENKVNLAIHKMELVMKRCVSKDIYEKMTQVSMGGRRLMLVNFHVARTLFQLINEAGLSLILLNCRAILEYMRYMKKVPPLKAELIRYIGLFECAPKNNLLRYIQSARKTHPAISFIRTAREKIYIKHTWIDYLSPKKTPLPRLYADRTLILYLSNYQKGKITDMDSMIVDYTKKSPVIWQA